MGPIRRYQRADLDALAQQQCRRGWEVVWWEVVIDQLAADTAVKLDLYLGLQGDRDTEDRSLQKLSVKL